MSVTVALLLSLALLVAWFAWRISHLANGMRRLPERRPASSRLVQREFRHLRSGVDQWFREHLRQPLQFGRRLTRPWEASEDGKSADGRDGKSADGRDGKLQKIWSPSQLRGAFGERQLEQLLADALSRDRFRVHYTYPSTGAPVDAVVLLDGDRLLPIDSSFPLDKYRRYTSLRDLNAPEAEGARYSFTRDVRRHVDSVAHHYISPDDGTLDVAFMYIPSESVFHEIALWGPDLDEPTLAEYAIRRQVILVSPSTLHAYLCVVRTGRRRSWLRRSARQVLQNLTHRKSDVATLKSEVDRVTSGHGVN